MVEKTKKQHYVPRCYLERWSNSKGKVGVFDKSLKKTRINNIYDVACERYFYDIDLKELSIIQANMLKKIGVNIESDSQFIEHFLARNVEGIFSELLTKIIKGEEKATPWYKKNCFFISNEGKMSFSICLAYQYIRTSSVRKSIVDMSNCLEQALQDKNVATKVLEEYTVKSGDEKNIHGNMILDADAIVKLAESFYKLTWILRANNTKIPFYTSDNPIGTIPHIDHPFMSMSGISSEGVEAYFPLSPKHLLVMYDGVYHKEISAYDRKYISITDIRDVNEYNLHICYKSSRCIFSSDNNFNLVNNVLDSNPEAFNIPKVELTWGEKKYRLIN